MAMNQAQFAKHAGISRQAVNKAVREGRVVVRNSDKLIDETDPVNLEYLNSIASAKRQSSGKQSAPGVSVILPAADDLEDADGLDDDIDATVRPPIGNLSDQDKAASIRLKTSQARRHELKLEQDKGRLIQVEMVERAAGKLHAEIRNRVQSLPQRIAPRILSLAVSGASEREIQEVLEHEIDDALQAVRAAAEALAVG